MTIEISNLSISGQSLEPAKETKTGEARIHANKAEQETGRPTETLTAGENASRCSFSDTARLLQQLHDAISNEPTVEVDRVQAALAKIKKGELGILKDNIKDRLDSAENIANKLLEAQAQLPDLTKNGGAEAA